MPSTRTMNFQSISWFWDVYTRHLLEMDPPYQRRSVWNQEYKDYFIDTILNGYSTPAIFLYQEITPQGASTYSVVDGKQRLSALFDFVKDVFPVSDTATLTRLRGKYFSDLGDDVKAEYWRYQFAVEYLQSADEKIINSIFDRINRNVARLTPQELRHARYGGEFITQAESLSEWMFALFPVNFPNITPRSKKQMKDVELMAQLLLLIEEGPKSYSQDDLDSAFSARDTAWEMKDEASRRLQSVIASLKDILGDEQYGQALARSRIRNQADFYSLVGAIDEIKQANKTLNQQESAHRLERFIGQVEDVALRANNKLAADYYEAARSASNDAGPRRARIDIIKVVLTADTTIEGPGSDHTSTSDPEIR